MVLQRIQNRIGYSSDAHLQGGTVLNQCRTVLPDLLLGFVGFRNGKFMQRLLRADQSIETTGMENAIAVRTWHIGIDQCNCLFRTLQGRPTYIYRYAKRAVAVLVRW